MAVKTGALVRLARPIVAAPLAHVGPGGILAALDLPGKIHDTISEILDYKKEIKKLEVEARRIDRKVALRHHQIDATLHLAIEELGQRSRHVRELLAEASADLARTRIDRRKITIAIVRLSDSVAAPGASVEDRKLAQAVLAELLKLQKAQMLHSQTMFDRAASATQAALNQSPNPRRVLGLQEE